MAELKQIITNCDDNYAKHLSVMLVSLFENNKGSRFCINVVESRISEQSKQILKEFVHAYDSEIIFIHFSFDDAILVEKNNFTKETYFRLYMTENMDVSINRVLYLDVDMIITGSLDELFSVDISGYNLAAIQDSFFDRHASLGMEKNSKYFNAGVMIVNLERLRERGLFAKMIDYLHENIDVLDWCDQDVLNACNQNEWLELPAKWNAVSPIFYKDFNELPYEKNDYYDAKLSPKIVHFTGKFKPWHYESDHPLKKEYYRYLALTPWKGLRPDGMSIKNIYNKYRKNLKKHLFSIFSK